MIRTTDGTLVRAARDAGRRQPPSARHVPVMVAELLRHARPRPGDVVVDATVGDGGHASRLAAAIAPGGCLLGIDRDGEQLVRAQAVLQPWQTSVQLVQGNFADLTQILATAGLPIADVIVADLGVASAQLDDPERGLHYKIVGSLDMRLDRTQGETATALIARSTRTELISLLRAGADEPHAATIAGVLKREPIATSHRLERAIRLGLMSAEPALSRQTIKDSVRRTFQALRIAVNDELGSLDRFLRAIPCCVRPGGRVVVLTFHEGENRRVRAAFCQGRDAGVYSAVSDAVLRPARPEILANRRSSSARLHWAIRA